MRSKSKLFVSLLVATERAARSLLPFSFGVSAKLGGRPITSSTYYMDVEGTTANLTALDGERVAVQSLRQEQHEEPFAGSNRLCVLKIDVVGTSNGSQIGRVRSAKC